MRRSTNPSRRVRAAIEAAAERSANATTNDRRRTALFAAVVLLASAVVAGAVVPGGTPIWTTDTDIAGGDDAVAAMAENGGSVIVAGYTSTAGGDRDLYIRSTDVVSGETEWDATVDASGGDDEAVAVVSNSPRAYAAGSTTNASGDTDFAVRAFRASRGEALWGDDFDAAGGDDAATAAAANGGALLVVGWTTNTDGNKDFVVRHYRASRGELLWEDTVDRGGDDVAWAVAAHRRQVFVAGTTTSADGDTDLIVRGYDASEGALLWEETFDGSGGDETVAAIAMRRRSVFVVGTTESGDGDLDTLIRGYHVEDGADEWNEIYDRSGGDDVIRAAVAPLRKRTSRKRRPRLIVVGTTAAPGGDTDLLMRAYDIKTANLFYENTYDLAGGDDRADAIGLHKLRAYVAGTSTNASGDTDFVVRAYDSLHGDLLWEHALDTAGGDDSGAAILSAKRHTAIAAGTATGAGGDTDVALHGFVRSRIIR